MEIEKKLLNIGQIRLNHFRYCLKEDGQNVLNSCVHFNRSFVNFGKYPNALQRTLDNDNDSCILNTVKMNICC